MKKLVFVAVVLAATIGVSSTTQAFWPFKKTSKPEIRIENNEGNGAVSLFSASLFSKGEKSMWPALQVSKNAQNEYDAMINGAVVRSVVTTNGAVTGFTADVTLGSSKFDLIIKVDEKTKVIRRYEGGGSALSSIIANHIISFSGTLDKTAAVLTVNAITIRDFSIQEVDANYSGYITAIEGNNITIKLPESASERNLIIKTDSSTKITLDDKVITTLQDIKTGMFVVNAAGTVDTVKRPMELYPVKVVKIKTSSSGQKIAYLEAARIIGINGDIINVETRGAKKYELRLNNDASFSKWMIAGGIKQRVLSTKAELSLATGDFLWFSGVIFLKDGIATVSELVKDFTGVRRLDTKMR